MNRSSGSPPQLLNVLSFGAGAIGTYIGGSLALQNHRVIFLERPEVAQELRQRGLTLILKDQPHAIPDPLVVGSIDEALAMGPLDICLFALKSFDTGPVLKMLAPQADRIPPVLCLQNGIDNEPALAEIIGAKGVIAGTVTSAIGRRGAGNIVLERLRGLGVAGGHPLSEVLVEALNQAGLNARLYPQAAPMKWSKMLTNLLANASSAILDMTPGEIFSHPGLYQLELAQVREALDVMSALGIGVVDLPGTPVRLLAIAVQRLPLALSRPLLSRAVGGGRGGKMPSFHIDLNSGRGMSEVDYLNGAVVRQAARLGLSAPANSMLNDTLLALTHGELPRNEYARQPDKFLSDFFRKSRSVKPAH
jgi:2-dehydropantoate 2-reductase